MERGFWIVVAVVVIAVGLILFQPKVEDTFAPQPESAWVAIQVEGDPVARVGPVQIAAGTPFRLHAVVGARGRGDELVYYTEAERVELGGQEIPADRLQRWNRSRTVKLRWYSVEGRWPYLPLDAELGVRAFEMQEFLRADWPLDWSVAGDIDALNDAHLEADRRAGRQRFGTQRYQVRFQVYERTDDLVPAKSIPSWGVDALKQHVDEFPTVFAVLPGRLEPASKLFGLTELEPAGLADAATLAQIAELADHHVAFSRLTLLRDQVAAAGLTFDQLRWTELDLDGSAPWDQPIGPGDLLRVGDRVVVLYEDQGAAGAIDYEDLCFDFVQGIEVRSLGDVFRAGDEPAIDPDTGKALGESVRAADLG